jgi:ankyrin repeat protein
MSSSKSESSKSESSKSESIDQKQVLIEKIANLTSIKEIDKTISELQLVVRATATSASAANTPFDLDHYTKRGKTILIEHIIKPKYIALLDGRLVKEGEEKFSWGHEDEEEYNTCEEIVEHLLTCETPPINVNFPDKNNRKAPIFHAIESKNAKLVTILLKYGANIDTIFDSDFKVAEIDSDDDHFDDHFQDIYAVKNPKHIFTPIEYVKHLLEKDSENIHLQAIKKIFERHEPVAPEIIEIRKRQYRQKLVLEKDIHLINKNILEKENSINKLQVELDNLLVEKNRLNKDLDIVNKRASIEQLIGEIHELIQHKKGIETQISTINNYLKKYLKYKTKYLQLKNQLGGTDIKIQSDFNLQSEIDSQTFPLHYIISKNININTNDMILYIHRYQENTKITDNFGKLPLHYLFSNHLESKDKLIILEKLLSINPDAARIKDNIKNLPLHYALLNYENTEENNMMIDKLIEIYPDSSRERDEHGELPLHLALTKNISKLIINKLINEFTVKERNQDGELPLHFALTNDFIDIFTINKLIELYPDAVSQTNQDGELSLHLALKHRIMYKEIIKNLFNAYPPAIRVKNQYGELPLHLALKYKIKKEIITILLDLYPDAVREKNIYGELALHLALKNNYNEEIIKKILNLYPGAVREKDDNNNLPLYYSLLYKSESKLDSYKLIRELIELYPNSANEKIYIPNLTKEPDEIYPLEVAMSRNLSLNVILDLISAWPYSIVKFPSVAKLRSDTYSILLFAIANNSNIEVIEKLLQKNPSAVSEKNPNHYNFLPLHYAIYNRSSYDIIFELLKKYPIAVREIDSDGNLPLHLACYYNDGTPRSESIIKLLITFDYKSIRVKNNIDILPLDIAKQKNASKEIIKTLIEANNKFPKESENKKI